MNCGACNKTVFSGTSFHHHYGKQLKFGKFLISSHFYFYLCYVVVVSKCYTHTYGKCQECVGTIFFFVLVDFNLSLCKFPVLVTASFEEGKKCVYIEC